MAVLTFAQDFTENISLDSSLIGVPDSSLYWNRGVHPLVTLSNLIDFLPLVEFTFSDYSDASTYAVFENSKNATDIVTYDGKIYESIKADNTDNQPDESPLYWLETNIDSLRIKSFIWSVKENAKQALQLSRSLIENQYIYNVSSDDTEVTLNGDYCGWAFEPKNSDYVKIVINQIAFKANTDQPVSLYVINQGQLIDTLTLTPENGVLSFEDVNYTINGKGRFLFVFENSFTVQSQSAFNDALKYDGFICYPVSGDGDTPQACSYVENSVDNGLNFNVSCYLDSSVYIDNNENYLAKFYQCQFEFDVINMILFNPNTKISGSQRMLNREHINQLSATEVLDLNSNTVARKYENEKKKAEQAISRTFDAFLKPKSKFIVNRRTL